MEPDRNGYPRTSRLALGQRRPRDLPLPEALLLDAMRAWGAAAHSGASPLGAATLPLVTADAREAAPALDAALGAVLRPGMLRCPLCPRVTAGEATLLLAFALAQRGPRREALAAFLRVAPQAAAYAAMGPALGLGLAFRRAGLWLLGPALRPADAARSQGPMPGA